MDEITNSSSTNNSNGDKNCGSNNHTIDAKAPPPIRDADLAKQLISGGKYNELLQLVASHASEREGKTRSVYLHDRSLLCTTGVRLIGNALEKVQFGGEEDVLAKILSIHQDADRNPQKLKESS